jgi:FMN phosphatase YigB (HAD superfamily)
MVHFYTPDNPYKFSHPIERAVFDNDGTLYKEPEYSGQLQFKMAVKAVNSFIPSLKKEVIEALIDKSVKKYGGSLEVFSKEDYRLFPEMLRRAHYKEFIEGTKGTDYFQNSDPAVEELAYLKSLGVKMAVATHGNDEWASYTYKQMGYTQIFNSNNTITKDSVPHSKKKGPEMFLAALKLLGVQETGDMRECGKGSVALEDSMKALEWAKKDLGMETIWINPALVWDNQDDIPEYVKVVMGNNLPDYVDLVVRNVRDAANCILWSNMQHGLHQPNPQSAFDYEG